MDIIRDVKYGEHERDILDFYPAEAAGARPLIIFVHGGGFINGDKEDCKETGDLAMAIKNNIAFASINYPLYTDMPLLSIIRHVGRAVQFFRANHAEYNIDANKIGCCGQSAGAGSTLYLCSTEDFMDENSADEVLHFSSKPNFGGLYATQATYNFFRWKEILSPYIENYDEIFLQNMSEVYEICGLDSQKDVLTVDSEVMKQLDMLSHISEKTSPVFVKTYASDEDYGDFMHYPAHARAVIQKCKEYNVPYEEHYAGDESRLFCNFFMERL